MTEKRKRYHLRGEKRKESKIEIREHNRNDRVSDEGMSQVKQDTTLLCDILHLLLKIVVIVVMLMLLFTYLFGIHRNRDISMQPTIKGGDLTVFYRLDKSYIAGDCVLVEYEGKKQVRRVTAVAGDTVNITEDGLVINGEPQLEMAIYEETNRYTEGIEFPVVVGEGEIFVLGDSRKNATDSRVYGCVLVKDTLGKVITLIRRRAI